jgi:NSS family neurotransmitter:Na+ symporter
MSAVTVGAVGFILGSLAAFSFNIFSDIRPLSGISMFSDKGFFDVFATIASDIIMPLGGLMIALFSGWVVKTKYSFEELFENKNKYIHQIWLFLVRYIAPFLLIILFYEILNA